MIVIIFILSRLISDLMTGLKTVALAEYLQEELDVRVCSAGPLNL